MKLVGNLFVALLCIGSSSCRTMPMTETCLIGDAGCLCIDPRLPDGEQEYTLTFEDCKNYVARSAESEIKIIEWMGEHCR